MEIFGNTIIQSNFQDFPVLAGRLRLPTNKWSPPIEFIVDTGYTGDILLSNNLFSIWSSKMQRIGDNWGESVTGELIRLQLVDTFLQLSNYQFQVVISSYPSITENLVGWNFLRKVVSVLKDTQIVLLEL